ncbi:MAG: S9 family peptidase [Candidatus Lokiarchaeota archaeon]|nr:S9 family peptidase [Candidatus Lokiarchaeota archaeon]
MSDKTEYINWKPLITPEEVFSDLIGFSGLNFFNNTLFWLETRPSEKGRTVLVREISKDSFQDITLKNYYLRTRVHEYGGIAYTINNDYIYFANFQDQRLYKQSLLDPTIIHPITPEKNKDGSLGKYGAIISSPDRDFLIFIYEKEYKEKENENYLACLDLRIDDISEPIILHKGFDFYGTPQISKDGKKIAWTTWNLPNMPWDQTILWEGDFKGSYIENPKELINKPNISICFPEYSLKNQLFFIMDKGGIYSNNYKNWWNLYYYDTKINPLTWELKEFGDPLWFFGERKYIFFDRDTIIISYLLKGEMKLNRIDIKTHQIHDLKLPFTEYSSITKLNNNSIAFIAAGPQNISSIYKYNLYNGKLQLIKKSSELNFPINSISCSRLCSFTNKNKDRIYGHLYLPKNHNYVKPLKTKPPLIVRIHGGPTARTYTSLSLMTQFWTSSGFAVFDIDYHGSTGYGRSFRDSLKGKWGIIDMYDIKNGIEYLEHLGFIDNKKCVITGGSAGGYAVQRILTMFPDLFQAGASYFGIGNLITLVKYTHKFESQYINTLVGGTIEDNIEIFKERSPKNHLDNLKAPMIIFQGSEDKIVTPNNSREIAEILTKKGIENYYYEYEKEAHGFRIKENKIDALTKEAEFYKKLLQK